MLKILWSFINSRVLLLFTWSWDWLWCFVLRLYSIVNSWDSWGRFRKSRRKKLTFENPFLRLRNLNYCLIFLWCESSLRGTLHSEIISSVLVGNVFFVYVKIMKDRLELIDFIKNFLVNPKQTIKKLINIIE